MQEAYLSGHGTLIQDQELMRYQEKRGTYNKVQSVSVSFLSEQEKKALASHRPFGLGNADQVILINIIARSTINRGSVSIDDIFMLSKDDSTRAARNRARVLESISNAYFKAKKEGESGGKGPLNHQLGLVMSDFLEVIPTNIAAKIFEKAIDPTFYYPRKDNNSYALATEAFVLLPSKRRKEIVGRIAAANPHGQPLEKFYIDLKANFFRSGDSNSGSVYIRKNIKGNADAKVKEVEADFPDLGRIVLF